VEGIGDRWIRTIHKVGLAWIYEVDDDVFSPRIVHRQSNLFDSEREKGPDQLEWERLERIRMLTNCDGVTVTSQRLKNIIRTFNDDVPIYVVPNAIDVKWFRLVMRGIGRVPELEGKLTIGWAGGTRESADMAVLVKTWPELARRYPQVMFAVQGHIDHALYDVMPRERMITLPWLPLDEFPRALINYDIGVCPVAQVGFNYAKSCIKWYEMTLAEIPCVVSDTLYGKEVTHGVDGLVAKTTEDWLEMQASLIESAELRKKLNRAARKTVIEQHSIENGYWRWPDAWADAIERFRAKPRLITAATAS
jgi:glycosyltransferase involved in cell wall biosynthesis